MGWKDAPVVDAEQSQPEWMNAPAVEEEQTNYLSGINKAMDEKAMEYAQKNLQSERYPLQHAVQKLNAVVDIPLSGLSKAVEPAMPIVKKAAKGILEGAAYVGGNKKANPEGTTKVIGEAVAPVIEKYQEAKDKYPLVEALGEFGQLGTNFSGIGGAGKIGTALVKEAVKLPSKTGEALEPIAKNFKLGDTKIKDSIAKKGYGKDLIDKKQNIANTIYDWGLTHGGNKGGYEKAGEIINAIHSKADDITIELSNDPNIELTNPVKIASDNLDINSLPAGKRKQAQAIADNIIADLKDEGLDDNLTVDKLIQAKRSIDTKGLFSNGPGTSGDDILDNAVRKKMYLALTNKIAELSPELKTLNTEAKKLYDAQEALGAASSRVANKDAISLSDWVFGAGTIANPAALPLLAVKKGLANGRGSDLLLNTARTLQGKKEKTVDDLLSQLQKFSNEKSTNADLPSDVLKPAFVRKKVPIIEREGKLISKGEDYTQRNWDTPKPTIKDRLDVWDLKAKPMDGIKRDTPLDIKFETVQKMSQKMEGINRGETIDIKPQEVKKFKEAVNDILTMKKKGRLY